MAIQTLGTLEGQVEELHRIPAAEADEGRGMESRPDTISRRSGG